MSIDPEFVKLPWVLLALAVAIEVGTFVALVVLEVRNWMWRRECSTP